MNRIGLATSVVIGSSNQTKFGVGTLMMWPEADIVSCTRDENGSWWVKVKDDDQEYNCMDIMTLDHKGETP